MSRLIGLRTTTWCEQILVAETEFLCIIRTRLTCALCLVVFKRSCSSNDFELSRTVVGDLLVWLRWYGFVGMASLVWLRWYGFVGMASLVWLRWYGFVGMAS